MSIPVVSATDAQALNLAVQRAIDPRLFLFCNFEPTVSYAISEDGKYLTGIQDLYKFALDSNCVIKHYWKFIPDENRHQFERLRETLDNIRMLRSVADHNQSEHNGKLERKRLEDYSRWLNGYINKPEPESQEDFSKLNQVLQDMAKDLLADLGTFIECVRNAPKKSDIVNSWIDETLRWYCSNTKTDIYIGQLMDTYISKAIAKEGSWPSDRDRYLRSTIRIWIKQALHYHVEVRLYDVSEKSRCAPSMDAGARTSESETDLEYPFALPKKEQLEELDDLDDLEGRNRAQFIRKLDDLFFGGLAARLRATMAYLDNAEIEYTLLPQDLLQEEIELFFGPVPYPVRNF